MTLLEVEVPSRAVVGALSDSDIRVALLQGISNRHAHEEYIVVNELSVAMGFSKLDVAVLNGLLEGFEIKSDRDSMARLGRQISQFEQVCDHLSIVTTERHVDAVAKIAPAWCGILIATLIGEKLKIETIRQAHENPNWDILALMLMLWQEETIKFAHSLGFKAPRDMAKGLIHAQLARRIPHEHLRHGVLTRLRERLLRSEGRPL